MLRNEKGLAMPLVLMILLVFTVLGTALWQYSMAETIQVAREENRMKAYYVAHSAVEATVAYMQDDFPLEDERPRPVTLLGQTASEENFGDGKYTIKVMTETGLVPGNLDKELIVITSEARVNGVDAKSSAVLNRIESLIGSFLTVSPIVGTGKVVINGRAAVSGPIESDEIINPTNSLEEQGQETIPLTNSYPNVVFPTLSIASPYDLNITSNYTFTYSEHEKRYGKIETNNNRVQFNTTNERFRIVVDEFISKNNGHLSIDVPHADFENINVEELGRVEIYVYDSITLRGNVNYYEVDGQWVPGHPNQFIIFAAPGSEVNLPKGDILFSGHIYGPGATINIAGSQELIGTIVGETVTIGGDVGTSGANFDAVRIPTGEYDFDDVTFELLYYISP